MKPKIEAYSEHDDYTGWSVEVYKNGIHNHNIVCKDENEAREKTADINLKQCMMNDDI